MAEQRRRGMIARYRKAAEQGDADAQSELAFFIQLREGA